MASLKHVKMSFSDPTNGFSRLHLGQCHSVAYIIPFWATGRSYHLLGRRDHSARTTTCWVRTSTMSFWWGTLSFLKRKETTTCLVCTSTMSFPDRGVQTMPSKSIKCEMGVFRHQVTAVWWNRFLWWLNKSIFCFVQWLSKILFVSLITWARHVAIRAFDVVATKVQFSLMWLSVLHSELHWVLHILWHCDVVHWNILTMCNVALYIVTLCTVKLCTVHTALWHRALQHCALYLVQW